ncbi:autotransporter domain-containing protein [Pleomorphomonas sp. PLEO]|uniref:autotransporter domain-containing protein n=1 Tax=Pleomorphomonas sp. PLEO TaxID=3239306 RepID=UPI00351DD04E
MLAADAGTFRLLTLNTWIDRFKPDASQISDFLINGNYDVMTFQELRSNSTYLAQIPGILSGAGLGTYGSTQIGDVGVISRLPGTFGSQTMPDLNSQGRFVSTTTVQGVTGLPETMIGTVHLDYADESDSRVAEAKALNDWAKGVGGPLIITGDFNAGDVSERGLHSAQQQAYLYARTIIDSGSSSLWQNLASEYTPAGREAEFQAYVDSMHVVDDNGSAHYRNVIQAYFDAHRSEYPGVDSISNMSWRQWEDIVAKDMASQGLTFNDETYPVASNTPQTLNVLKKQFMVLQNSSEREPFAPHGLGDGSTTWPSRGEDATNTWTSWDRVTIDHFLVSRPYGKWWTLADSPSDPYLGVLDGVGYANDGTTTLSDHEPVAHTMKWIGPALEKYAVGGGAADQTRLVWGTEAAVFQDKGKVFYLTRNNMRTDLYLGQISDDNGMPLLTGLTDTEKKTLLDCKSSDPRFQQAIQDYCIDDHSFIGETLVKDGGTVIVDEDAALGTSAAALRLDDGTLKIAGTTMTALDRSVVLESGGGTIDVDDATNKVTMAQVISGSGSLTKAGAGTLNVTGTQNTYTGQTFVEGGRLAVNGSIATSVLTTVGDGGTLGGNGTVGNLVVASGGKVAPGNSIGQLNVAGNVTLQNGSVYEAEVDTAGHADLLKATGSITIDSGARLSLAANSNYRLFTNYELLSAPAGVSGQFDSIVSDFAFLSPDLVYSASGISFKVNRNGLGFASAGTTRNRVAAAGGIESLGSGNALYDAVLSLNAATADQAFRQVSGEIYPSIVGALAEDSRFVRDAVEQRLSSTKAVARAADQAGQATSDYQAWSQGFGSKGSTDGSGVDALDRRTGGLLMGADGVLSDKLRLGFFGGYGRSSFSEDGSSASANADNYLLGFYGSTALDAVRLSFGGSFALSSIKADRDVAFSSFTDSLHSDYTAATAQLFGEAAYRVDLGEAMIEPFAGLAQVHVSTDGFREQGGAAALSVDDNGYDLTYTNIGLRAATSVDINGITVHLKGEAAWRHAFGDVTPETSMALSGGSAFDVKGASAARDTAVVKAGIDVDLTKDSTVFVNYVGEFASGGPDHGVNAGFKLKF